MSGEVLREAAALMRERAQAATPGPWEIRNGYDHTLVQQGSNWPDGADEGLGQIYGGPTAQHIASWHPTVALAVADWLDQEADRHEALTEHGARGLRTDGQVPNAFTIARAYLGATP